MREKSVAAGGAQKIAQPILINSTLILLWVDEVCYRNCYPTDTSLIHAEKGDCLNLCPGTQRLEMNRKGKRLFCMNGLTGDRFLKKFAESLLHGTRRPAPETEAEPTIGVMDSEENCQVLKANIEKEMNEETEKKEKSTTE